MRWVSLLAQSEIPTTAYGLIAAAAMALVSGFVFVAKWMLTTIENLIASKDEMNKKLMDDVVPALTKTMQALDTSTAATREATALMKVLADEGLRRRPRDER